MNGKITYAPAIKLYEFLLANRQYNTSAQKDKIRERIGYTPTLFKKSFSHLSDKGLIRYERIIDDNGMCVGYKIIVIE